MRIARIAAITVCVVAFPLVLGQGCPTDGVVPDDGGNGGGDGGGGSDLTADDLTDAEKAAINAAANGSALALAQATNTTQNATGGDAGSAQSPPSDICVGICPEVCKSGSILQGEVDLTIDFGDGCMAFPLLSEEQYMCSGSASGTFSQSARTIGLTYNTITCEGEMLDGMTDLTYDLSLDNVQFTGDWDLTWTSNDGWKSNTDGQGTGGYDFLTYVTSIPTFVGSVSDLSVGNDPYVWSIDMKDVLVSFMTYYSYLPYRGTMTLSGPEIRTLTLTFDESSPTTGDVQVSIAGGPSFTVNVFTLLYYEEYEE